MLDRIINIRSDFQFKSGSRKHSGLEKLFFADHDGRSGVHDSMNFSPAANLLARVNWGVKDVKVSGSDRISVIFIIEGFEFHAEFDRHSFYVEPRQFYSIIKTNEQQGRKIKTLLRISIKKEKLAITDNPEPKSINGIRKLFDRIFALELSGEIDKYDSSALKTLFDGINDSLSGEFEYINGVFFSLIDKLSSHKLVENFIFASDHSDHIVIEKITAINDK